MIKGAGTAGWCWARFGGGGGGWWVVEGVEIVCPFCVYVSGGWPW